MRQQARTVRACAVMDHIHSSSSPVRSHHKSVHLSFVLLTSLSMRGNGVALMVRKKSKQILQTSYRDGQR